MAFPKPGVYATKTHYNGRYYNSITNVGNNPTFGENLTLSVETYIFNFDENLYGKEIEVYFLERIRHERRFESVEELKKQLKIDVENAKTL
jgi:riboflavin kinase/FMN adenylyltransferase